MPDKRRFVMHVSNGRTDHFPRLEVRAFRRVGHRAVAFVLIPDKPLVADAVDARVDAVVGRERQRHLIFPGLAILAREVLDGPLAGPLRVNAVDVGDEEVELAIMANDAWRPPGAFVLDRPAESFVASADAGIF